MRVLITGAAGFIGSHLHERLKADGHEVWGVDNFLTGHNHVEDVTPCDIVDRTRFYEIANYVRPELVIHCAASYSDPNLWHRDAETNVLGTINATLAAKHHGARLFYFNTALPPISSYAISKIAGGQYIEQSGVPAVTFRLSNIYGPRNLSGPIPTFYKRLSAGEACTVVDTRRDMVYIDDLVRAVENAISRVDVTGTIDICSGTHRPIMELFKEVTVAMAGPEFATAEELPAPTDDVAQMELNPSRALTELDWAPFVPLHEGIGAAVGWYAEHGVGATYTHLRLGAKHG